MSTTRDHEIVDELTAHHDRLVKELDELTAAFVADPDDSSRQQAVIDWVHEKLLPHAEEEERTSYAAAAALTEGAALVDAMIREHDTIKVIAGQMHGTEGALSAGFARALYFAFVGHQDKENEIVFPMLLAAPGVVIADVMAEHLEGAGHGHGHDHVHQH